VTERKEPILIGGAACAAKAIVAMAANRANVLKQLLRFMAPLLEK